MKRRGEYRMCRRKKKYNLRQAHRVAEHINDRQDAAVHVYLCPICQTAYHVGKPNNSMRFESDLRTARVK